MLIQYKVNFLQIPDFFPNVQNCRDLIYLYFIKIELGPMDNYDIIIYSDGSSLGNPGPGGFGAVIIEGGSREEISGGFRKTTNNRMELLAAIHALRSIDGAGKSILLNSDSKLMIDAFKQNWIGGWKRRNWRKSNGDGVLNKDLWEELDRQANRHKVSFKWVKGHVGIPENERCDELAKQAAEYDELPVDTGYEGLPGIPVYEIEPSSTQSKIILIRQEEWTLENQKFTFQLLETDGGEMKLKILQNDETNIGSVVAVEDNINRLLEALGSFIEADKE